MRQTHGAGPRSPEAQAATRTPAGVWLEGLASLQGQRCPYRTCEAEAGEAWDGLAPSPRGALVLLQGPPPRVACPSPSSLHLGSAVSRRSPECWLLPTSDCGP